MACRFTNESKTSQRCHVRVRNADNALGSLNGYSKTSPPNDFTHPQPAYPQTQQDTRMDKHTPPAERRPESLAHSPASSPAHLPLDSALLMLDIMRDIPRRQFTTSSIIQQQLENKGHRVSLRTVQRYLDIISQRFPIECDQRGKPFGYRWMQGAVGLSIPYLSPAESLVLLLAQRELVPLMPASILQSVNPLLSGAAMQLQYAPDPERQRRWLRKVRRIPDSLPLLAPRLDENVLEDISNALHDEYMLQLRYQNARGEIKEATVMPLGLAQQGSRLYLVARFEGYDNQRILALPRILEARATSQRFEYPKDFDLAEYEDDGHFGIRSGQRIRLRFCIDPIIGQHLTESPLSEDQQVKHTEQGLVVEATLNETELLHRWLRGWGEALRWFKIEPKECLQPTLKRKVLHSTNQGKAP